MVSESMFKKMISDIENGGSISKNDMERATYALGYNLAIEFLADYEKTWMLDSFKFLNNKIFLKLQKKIDWTFLEIHAIGKLLNK